MRVLSGRISGINGPIQYDRGTNLAVGKYSMRLSLIALFWRTIGDVRSIAYPLWGHPFLEKIHYDGYLMKFGTIQREIMT